MISSKAPFDQTAAGYDCDFTFSGIGRAQREIVYDYLEKNIVHGEFRNILELNCGTGEDAVFFAKKEFNVLATDISDEMLKMTEAKVNSAGLKDKICFKKLDINDIPSANFEKKFDLIFSNFGGFNCISLEKMEELSGSFRRILNPPGRIILIFMASFTFWEILYFLTKRKLKDAFRRRNKKGINVKLKGSEIHTWYYSPGEIKKIFAENFKLIGIKPVGFFIPPTYMENFFKRKAGLFQVLKKSERLIKNISLLSPFSDHFLIDLEAKR
ncbi:MAG TPA: methyltransferase domain-containing protein [Ignavibacteriaceae bacterium]|nr:methyltransferase domain-containing protein [Ignavibacteriaceae bacterium]